MRGCGWRNPATFPLFWMWHPKGPPSDKEFLCGKWKAICGPEFGRGSSQLNGRPTDPKRVRAPPRQIPIWERVQVLARHPKRPHTSDYISRIFTGFFRAARRSILWRRRCGDGSGFALLDARPVMVIGARKGPRHQTEATPQLWDAETRRLSQGHASDANGRQIPAAHRDLSWTLSAHTRVSTPKSAAKPRPSRIIFARCRGSGVPVITGS